MPRYQNEKSYQEEQQMRGWGTSSLIQLKLQDLWNEVELRASKEACELAMQLIHRIRLTEYAKEMADYRERATYGLY